jgi:hypothetical protein
MLHHFSLYTTNTWEYLSDVENVATEDIIFKSIYKGKKLIVVLWKKIDKSLVITLKLNYKVEGCTILLCVSAYTGTVISELIFLT